jgi:hypothetical protein
VQTITNPEILASLPSKPVVDQMISAYFDTMEMSSGN